MKTDVKGNRKTLFRKSRPHIRPFAQEDMGWLWAAYKVGSFKIPEGLSQQTFVDEITPRLGSFENFIVDDDSNKFKSKRGPVALICVTDDGWKYEPAIIFFKWATKKNMLRASVSFFHKSALSNRVGVCVVKWGKSTLLDHLKKYGVLFPRGKIPMGSKTGDEYIYSILGRKGSEALKAGV
jgi:hypothetical protein